MVREWREERSVWCVSFCRLFPSFPRFALTSPGSPSSRQASLPCSATLSFALPHHCKEKTQSTSPQARFAGWAAGDSLASLARYYHDFECLQTVVSEGEGKADHAPFSRGGETLALDLPKPSSSYALALSQVDTPCSGVPCRFEQHACARGEQQSGPEPIVVPTASSSSSLGFSLALCSITLAR